MKTIAIFLALLIMIPAVIGTDTTSVSFCTKDDIECNCKQSKDFDLCILKYKCSADGQSKEEVIKCICSNYPHPEKLKICKKDTTTTTITTTTTTIPTPIIEEKKKGKGTHHIIYIGKILRECHEFEGKIYKFITLVGINKTFRLNKVCEE